MCFLKKQTTTFLLPICVAAACLSACHPPRAAAPLHRFQFSRPAMGTEFNLIFYATDSAAANAAADAAYRRVEELEQIFSDYRPDSEVSRLSDQAGSGQWVAASADLWHLTQMSLQIHQTSEGAFDVTLGALTRQWRRAFRQKEFPKTFDVQRALTQSGSRYLELDENRQSLRLTRPGVRLDFGGIGQGYAVDEALKVITRLGIHSALADSGGDIAATDAPPGTPGWQVRFPGSERDSTIFISHSAVTTSGDTYRYLEWEGRRYSHILDPRTGMGLTSHRLVTVFAPNCTLADAWATAASVGVSESILKKLDTEGIRVIVRQN